MAPPPTSGTSRAPTLYAIIAARVVKGVLWIAVAVMIYRVSGSDLPEAFRRMLRFIHLDPEREFFVRLTTRLADVTPRNVVWAACGTALYGLLLLAQGVGLAYRAWWAGWLAIATSLFFVPIELHELLYRFSWWVLGLLAVNLGIAWYLYHNRKRLFHH